MSKVPDDVRVVTWTVGGIKAVSEKIIAEGVERIPYEDLKGLNYEDMNVKLNRECVPPVLYAELPSGFTVSFMPTWLCARAIHEFETLLLKDDPLLLMTNKPAE